MNKFTEFQKDLLHITESALDEEYFIDGLRERELLYSTQCSYRWFEVMTLLREQDIHGTILDVGTSPFTFFLKNQFNHVHCLDYTDGFRKRCVNSGITLHVGGDSWETNDQVPDGYFDCVTFLEVLEHLHANPEKVLLFLKKKLRPGGLLVMSTPNLMCLKNRVMMLLNKKLKHLSYPAFEPNVHSEHGYMHDRVYMAEELQDYFSNTGWTSFNVGYQSTAAVDSDRSFSIIQRSLRFPIRVLKQLIPSLRGLMLVVARK